VTIADTTPRDLAGQAGAAASLPELFEAVAAAHGGRVALTDGKHDLRYAELNAAANRIAHRLIRLGAGPGVVVGVCGERNTDLVISLLAVVKAGAAYLPLDPRYPADRLRFTLADAGCRLAVGQAAFRDLIGAHATYVPVDTDAVDGEQAGNPAVRVRLDDLAYVIYTSGSTGRPKGVTVTHANVTWLFEATRQRFAFTEDDVWTLFHSFAFDFSVWELWGALLHGGRLVVVPFDTSRSPESFWRLVVDQRVTVLNQTPSAFQQLIPAAQNAGYPGTGLRLVIFGGEALDPATLRPWTDAYGTGGPVLVNMYGITETTVHVTARTITAADTMSATSPIGLALDGLRLHVLDERMNPIPPGRAGELYVGGAGLARGYLGQPGLTARRFVPDPFGRSGERLYRTGDLVSTANGELIFHGRTDDQVQLRGFRIELGEVESVLGAHPEVARCVAQLREDTPGGKRLIGYYVPVAGAAPAASELREWCARTLPDYMVPSIFVCLDTIPLTLNGKVDRHALPAPGTERTASRAEPVAGRTPAERAIATIWARALHLDQVGVHDDFFELGGDSLLATRVAFALREEFGVEVAVGALFRFTTVEALAQAVTSAMRKQQFTVA